MALSCIVGITQGCATGDEDVSKDSEQVLMSTVGRQPLSIIFEADQFLFKSYSSGVLTASRESFGRCVVL